MPFGRLRHSRIMLIARALFPGLCLLRPTERHRALETGGDVTMSSRKTVPLQINRLND
jgi:hypothetical protein